MTGQDAIGLICLAAVPVVTFAWQVFGHMLEGKARPGRHRAAS